MIVYIIMLLLSIAFLYATKKVKKKWIKIVCYIMAAMPFFIVSAFRYDVGTDYFARYAYDYGRMLEGANIKNLEILFKALMYFCMLFTEKPYMLFFITSALIVGLFLGTAFKQSQNVILSVCIFFLAGFFFDSLNIMRQYLAMSIVFAGYPLLLKNKKWCYAVYAIIVGIAICIHSSAFIMLALLLLTKKMLVSWKWVIPVGVVILILNENLMDWIGLLVQNTRFGVYLTGKFAKGDVSFLFIAENLVIYLMMYYIYAKNKKIGNVQKADILFLNVQAIALLTMILGSCHMLFIRTELYFSVLQIVSVPYYINKMPVNEIEEKIKKITKNKIKIDKWIPKMQTIMTIVVILCFTFAIVRTNIMNNTNEVLPYRTVFNPKIKIN